MGMIENARASATKYSGQEIVSNSKRLARKLARNNLIKNTGVC